MEIRNVTLNDVGRLKKIGIQTFTDTYSSSNSEENMTEYLDNWFSTEKLKFELLDKNSKFYFAEIDNEIIGYLKINIGLSQKELIEINALEIERIYVLKEFHGKKVGQLLYDKAIEIAKEKNVNYVWLGVWERNPRAIRFYEKNGFQEFDKRVFIFGDDAQTDIMMKLKLN